MKKSIIPISICFLMNSCQDYKHHDIPQDKIPALKNNDILCFQDSASSKIDTFRLNIIDVWYETLESNFYRYIYINYNFIDRNKTFLHLSFTSAAIQPSTGIYIDNFFPDQRFIGNTKTNVSIHGVNYPIVEILYDNDYNNHYPDTVPNTIYITYKKGIIRYEYKDGRVYNLVSK